MINIKNLSLKFENQDFFQNAEFNLIEEKINIIAGPNGVGKTTILKILAGIIKPQSAIIEINPQDVFYLPQRIKYPSKITLYEYLSCPFYEKSWKWFLTPNDKNKIDEVIDTLELYDKKNVIIDVLSSGEMQKANIALGLLSDARVLLLDEPTSNMDLVNQIKVLNIIKKLTQKKITVVIVLHDINLSASYGDYFIGIRPDKTVFCGEKEEFFTQQNLQSIYNINFRVIQNDEDFHVQIFT